jgi:hypothetical protein
MSEPRKTWKNGEALSLLKRRLKIPLSGKEDAFHVAQEPRMNSDEFACYGPRLAALNETIASCCAHRDCVLETTALPHGAGLRISGPDQTVREAIRTVRLWIRNTN